MKPIRFIHGVGAALVLSVFGSVIFASLASVLATGVLLKALIALLGLAYIAFLLSHSKERLGRPTAIAFWLAGALGAWYFAPSLIIYTVIHLGMLWLLRSLYFYSSALAALLDLGLTSLAFSAALWAAKSTNSVFLSIWCFFLVQAVFPAIPPSLQPAPSKHGSEENQNFSRAQRSAEAALRRISVSS